MTGPTDPLAALEQCAVLAEYGTTGPGKCQSGPLTAKQATALRLAISNIARAAAKAAESARHVEGKDKTRKAKIAKMRQFAAVVGFDPAQFIEAL